MTARRYSPQTQAILARLADGQWHERAELLEAARAAVPPGRAYRAGERDRIRKRTGDTTARTRGDRQTSIDAGAQRVLVEALRGLVRFGTVVRDGNRYRLVKGRP